MEPKQSYTFVEKGDPSDKCSFTIFGHDGKVHIEFRTHEIDVYRSTIYSLSVIGARILVTLLNNLILTEEKEEMDSQRLTRPVINTEKFARDDTTEIKTKDILEECSVVGTYVEQKE
jgi:hypothetical protein